MRKYLVLKLGGVLVALYISLSVIAGAFVAEGALHPTRRQLTSSEIQEETLHTGYENAVLADVTTTASDGIVLRAWEIRPENTNGDAVILLHGLSDNRVGMQGYADLFLSHGYSVLIPDARGHGVSGGALATYGLLESNNIRRWFDWLIAAHHPHCIYGFGESMGAAQLLQSLGTEPHFCAVAVECPFSNFREIAYDRVGQQFKAGPWLGRTILRPVVESAFLYSRWKYRLDFEQVSPENIVASTVVPVFLIHDKNDTNIPIRHSRRIVDRNPSVVLWEVPNAGHTGAVNAFPEEFSRKIVEWFESHSQRELSPKHIPSPRFQVLPTREGVTLSKAQPCGRSSTTPSTCHKTEASALVAVRDHLGSHTEQRIHRYPEKYRTDGPTR